jgi:ABC-type transport system involved in cytochrome c biogenesis ATPase subunit
MRIQRIDVTNVAGIAEARVELGPGLNILHGPNELGKSSLVRAIRSVLLLQSTSATAESLFDWYADAPPTVSLTLEQGPGHIWRVRKTFGSSGESYLEFSKNGRDFSQDSKGREVDGKLQGLLRWGVEVPGGQGRRTRGMPESLITTALLGEQSDVVGILRRSLADDVNASGRERLTEALQAMAEHPLFKQVMLHVQAKVDEAFTGSGRRKRDRTSPWMQVLEDRQAAERRAAEVQQQLDESQAARLRGEELHRELLVAQAHAEAATTEVGRIATNLQRREAHEQASAALAQAEREVRRIREVIAARDAKAEAVEAARANSAAALQAREAADRARTDVTSRIDAARTRVRELESGAAEQRRRIREQDAVNQLQRLDSRRNELAGIKTQAERVSGLNATIGALQQDINLVATKCAEETQLLDQAREVSENEQDQLAELELQRMLARSLAADAHAKDLTTQFDSAIANRSRASALDTQATEVRTAIEHLHAPSDPQIARLRSLETELLIAREKLAVGFLVTLTPNGSVDVVITTDGVTETRHLLAGSSVEIETDRNLGVDLPGFGELRVRGGNADLVQKADAAQARWDQASAVILGATGARTIADLDSLQRKARERGEEARDLEQQAAGLRIRAEGAEGLERRATLAGAEAARAWKELAEALADCAEPVSVKDYRAEFDEPPTDERAIAENIEDLEASIREREELRNAMEAKVAGDRARLETQRNILGARTDDLARESAALDGDSTDVLHRVAVELQQINAKHAALSGELASIRNEATTEVEKARSALSGISLEATNTDEALNVATAALDRCRHDLSRLEGELTVQREAAEREDVEGAQARLISRTQALDALPHPDDGTTQVPDLDQAQRDATSARNRVKELEVLLNRQQGALEQVGGQYIEEQADQAREALESIAAREHSLDVEYGAWQLLRNTLAEAEKESSVHLGNALVEPVSKRMADLTTGRYGNIAIDPQLKAMGIQIGGNQRDFDVLSVGTQEQIALLLRLSIAEALGTFVILDDQLTQSDTGRMAWMRELLDRAAQRIQIVVLTCHPQDYVGNGSGEERVVDLVGCVRRNVAPGSGASARTVASAKTDTDAKVSTRATGDTDDSVLTAKVSDTKAASNPRDPTAPDLASSTRRRRRPAKEDPDSNLADSLRRTLERKDGFDPKNQR